MIRSSSSHYCLDELDELERRRKRYANNSVIAVYIISSRLANRWCVQKLYRRITGSPLNLDTMVCIVSLFRFGMHGERLFEKFRDYNWRGVSAVSSTRSGIADSSERSGEVEVGRLKLRAPETHFRVLSGRGRWRASENQTRVNERSKSELSTDSMTSKIIRMERSTRFYLPLSALHKIHQQSVRFFIYLLLWVSR